jgi:hypothetical protein
LTYTGDKLILEADGLTSDDIYDAEAHDRINSIIQTLNTLNDDIANAEANAKAEAEEKLAEYKAEAATNLANVKDELNIAIEGVNTGLSKVDGILTEIIQLDDDKTVIDGGKIATGSIMANSIAAGAINTALIQGGKLTGLTIDSNNGAWEIDGENGSAKFAKGNVEFKANGDVIFGPEVSISWSSAQKDRITAIEKATDDVRNTANQAINDAADAKTQAINEAKSYADTMKDNLLNSIEGKVDSAYTERIGSKLTHIDANGIYSGTIAADNIVGLTIDASQITSGTIDASRITLTNYATKTEVGGLINEAVDGLTITGDMITGGDITGLTISSGENGA